MALLIDKITEISNGSFVDQIYLRLKYTLDLAGTEVECNLFPYESKTKFSEDLYRNKLMIKKVPGIIEIPNKLDFSYDSSINGSDVLAFLHEEVKDVLITPKYIEEPILDPSAGIPGYDWIHNYKKDPSTGEIMYQSILSRDKFAEDSSISFVDLD